MELNLRIGKGIKNALHPLAVVTCPKTAHGNRGSFFLGGNQGHTAVTASSESLPKFCLAQGTKHFAVSLLRMCCFQVGREFVR